jgi:hypothetical protein
MLGSVTRKVCGSLGALMSITGALQELKFTLKSCFGQSNFVRKGEPITLTVRIFS